MQVSHNMLYDFVTKNNFILYVIISAGLAVYLLYGNFSATWGILDDHQIMLYLSSFQEGNGYVKTLLNTANKSFNIICQ